MSVLKYKDPQTGEYKITRTVKVVNEGGGAPEQLVASGYPDYVTPEVVDMVERVRAVRKDGSIVFVAMSDSHYIGEENLNFYDEETNASTVQANQAAKVLSYLVKPDFFAHLGDLSCGAASTTPDMLKSQIETFIGYFREARSDLPVFIAIGNHDTGFYYHDAQTDGNIHTMTGKYLYDNFTAYSASPDTVFGGEENGGYCYRDFADKKLRVFLLNSCEKLVTTQEADGTYGAQRLWLANALLDLNSKDDAVDWGFIILCHYPADCGRNIDLSELIKAYVEGKSFAITDPGNDYIKGDGTYETIHFAGNNGAKFIAQFHGHIHNFLVDKLYSYATGSGVPYDAWRVCVPNGQFGRENTYTTVGSYTDIDYSEDRSYPKTADTAEGTSFVVNVINPDEEKIYSFCYGAGYDRVIGYGATVYHAITTKLTNVTSDNTAKSAEDGAAYTATLTPDDGYHFKSVTVTMGGKDITTTAYADGVVTIPAVTGNVIITARAQMTPNFTNLVPLSVDKNGADFNVDGDGYDDDVYISTTTTDSGYAENIKAKKGSVTTGYIPVTAGAKIVRVAGDGLSIDPVYTKIATYDANFNMLSISRYDMMNIQHSSGEYYHGRLIEEESTLFTLEMSKNCMHAKGVYLRICTPGDGADMIVTVDEPITYG